MKILLIKPPLNPNLLTNTLYEPLELEYLAASVSDSSVRILDMRIDNNLQRELSASKPHLVGITAYTCDMNTVNQILQEVRKFDKSIKTAVGGHHVTFSPGDFVKPYTDTLFLGYSDSTFPKYVNVFDNPGKVRDIPNIGIIEEGKVSYTRKEAIIPDLKLLPLPHRNLTQKYHRCYHDSVGNKLSLVMTSRGCPFRCNFCACWKLMDGRYAERTPESLVEELKTLPEDINIVYFSDDNTFSNINRIWRLCELIKKNNIKKILQMYARADTVIKHRDLFENLKEAGLRFITIGIESFKDEDLKDYNKKTSVHINNQAIRILKDLDLCILSHFIVRPEYSKNDFNDLYRYVHKENLFRPAFPVLTPLPGTELFNETVNNFELTNCDYFDFAHSILPTKLAVKEFYCQLANLYKKSYSVLRYIKFKLARYAGINKDKYFTGNTDGISLIKLLLLSIFARGHIKKLKRAYMVHS